LIIKVRNVGVQVLGCRLLIEMCKKFDKDNVDLLK